MSAALIYGIPIRCMVVDTVYSLLSSSTWDHELANWEQVKVQSYEGTRANKGERAGLRVIDDCNRGKTI